MEGILAYFSRPFIVLYLDPLSHTLWRWLKMMEYIIYCFEQWPDVHWLYPTGEMAE